MLKQIKLWRKVEGKVGDLLDRTLQIFYGTEWYTNGTELWYKYGTSMVQVWSRVKIWYNYGENLVELWYKIMVQLWTKFGEQEFPQISPIIVPYCTIICTIF